MNNSYKKAMDKFELSYGLKEKIINNASKPKAEQISKFKSVPVIKIAGIAACFAICFLSYYAVTNYTQTPTNIVTVDTPKPSPSIEVSTEPVLTIQDNKTDDDETTVAEPSVCEKVEDTYNHAETALPKQTADTEVNSSDDNNELPPFPKRKIFPKNNADGFADESQTINPEKKIQSPQKIPAEYELSDFYFNETACEIIYQSANDTITYQASKHSENLNLNNVMCDFMEIVNINNTDVVLKGIEDLYYNAAWSDSEQSFSITSDNGVEKSVLIDMISSVD